MKIEKMDANKWHGFVKAEFEKLTSCKAGKIITEGRARIGNQPSYSTEERETILKESSTRIQVELKGRISDMLTEMDVLEAHDSGFYEWMENNGMDQQLDDIIREFKLFDHPLMKEYEERHKRINEEVNTRELVMRKDADNMVRNFTIGIHPPEKLNEELNKFEGAEY